MGIEREAGKRTPRIAYSTSLFEDARPNATAIVLDHDVVSSVVVLMACQIRVCVR